MAKNLEPLQRKLIKRIKIFVLPILGIAAVCSFLSYRYAKKQPVLYTALATMFTVDNSGSGLGVASLITGTSNFGNEANVYILDVANSRRVREEVAATRLPEFGMRTIAELIIESINAKTKQSIKIPKDQSQLVLLGSSLIAKYTNFNMTKYQMVEVRFSGYDPELLTPVSNVLIRSIGDFYRSITVAKAERDYNFTSHKLDSINNVLQNIDAAVIQINNTTRFVPGEKIEYTIKKENIVADKNRVTMLKTLSANNKEEALWRLERIKPVIQILDLPVPPFTETAPSKTIYGIVGFIVGLLASVLLFGGRTLIKYILELLKKDETTAVATKNDNALTVQATTPGLGATTTTTSAI